MKLKNSSGFDFSGKISETFLLWFKKTLSRVTGERKIVEVEWRRVSSEEENVKYRVGS